MAEPARLTAMLGSYPHTLPLKQQRITSPLLTLTFEEVEPVHKAFKPMAMRQNRDICEMAIVTYLQAKSYNKPIFMLPFVVAARFQQGCIIHNAARGPLGLPDLRGKKIGVRSYAQTTGVWVRGILHNTYGIAPDANQWITFDPAHLEEYQDPAWCLRAAPEQKLLPMLRAGEIDAAILGNDLPDEAGLVPLITDHEAADQAWYQQNRFVPINHVVVMTHAAARANPGTVAALYAMLLEAKAAGQPQPTGIDRFPAGFDALREPLTVLLRYCEQQNLLGRPVTFEEIRADFEAFV